MKCIAMLLIVAVLFLAGCEYEAPLTEEHSIPVDSSVLGLWEIIPDSDKKSDAPERMMLLKYTDTEYLIHHPTGEDGLYFRGYPIKIGDVSCVQIQWIGTAEGDIKKDDRDYNVVSYNFSNGELVIKTLNTDLVDDDLKDSEALKKAFLKNKDNKDLFTDPGKFRKVKTKS